MHHAPLDMHAKFFFCFLGYFMFEFCFFLIKKKKEEQIRTSNLNSNKQSHI